VGGAYNRRVFLGFVEGFVMARHRWADLMIQAAENWDGLEWRWKNNGGGEWSTWRPVKGHPPNWAVHLEYELRPIRRPVFQRRVEVPRAEWESAPREAPGDGGDGRMSDVLPPPPGDKDGWFTWWQSRYGKLWSDKMQEENLRIRSENEALRKLCLRWLRKWQTEMDPTPGMLEDTHALIHHEHTPDCWAHGCRYGDDLP
jgi:hypothetical protein